MNRRVAAFVAFWVSAAVFSAVVWWLIGAGLWWFTVRVLDWLNG